VSRSAALAQAARLDLQALERRAEAARLEADARALEVEAARLRVQAAEADDGPADDLVPLDETPLEAKAARRLERDGALPVRRIGRRKYTTRAALAALIATPAPPASSPRPVEPADEDPREAARRAYPSLTSRQTGRR